MKERVDSVSHVLPEQLDKRVEQPLELLAQDAQAEAPAGTSPGGETKEQDTLPPYLQGLAGGSTPRPRSPRRRLERQAAPPPPDVQSQPLPEPVALAQPRATPVVEPEWEPKGPWRWTPAVAGLAVLAWIVAVGLLATGATGLESRVSSPRVMLAAAWAFAAAVTFLPIQLRLDLPGLTWQGIAGWTLLGYILAYVPPPTGWLLDLPDLPVYLLFFLALFYAVATAALPLTFLLGQRIYTRRIHRLDVRRARRQAYEFGLLAVALMLLAALRVLSALTGLLLVAVFVLVETLLLSQVTPDG